MIGAYFITVCTRNRILLFGEVIDNDVRLNQLGTLVTETWDALPAHYRDIDLDAFVVMPNHVHGIIMLADKRGPRGGIPEIVRGFKTFSARSINQHRQTRGRLWQRGHYEHVSRNETALNRIRSYIENNPRAGRTIPTISHQLGWPHQGGFETRPYKTVARRLAR